MHRLSVLKHLNETSIERQRWINAIQDHINYSTHYLWGVEQSLDDGDYGKLR